MTTVYIVMFFLLIVCKVRCQATKCFSVCQCESPTILCNLTTTSASIPNFTPLTGFTSLDIRGGPAVSQFHVDTFPATWDIKELRISHTNLSTMGCTALDAFKDSLETLSLINNTLTDIDGCLLGRLKELKTVVIQENPITSLKSGIIFDISKVTNLNLGRNQIQTIDKSAILSAPLLQTLILGRNRIKSLHIGQFEELLALEYLDLSYNDITVLSVEMFRGISGKLKVLDISNNRIAASSWSVTLEALQSISLLTSLNLSGNTLTVIRPSDFNQTMPNLDTLNISGCNLRDVPWRFLEGLKELYVANNKLDIVSLDLIAPVIACTVTPCTPIIRDVSGNSIAAISVKRTFTDNTRELRILATGTDLRNLEVFLKNRNPASSNSLRPHLSADLTRNRLTKPINIYISQNTDGKEYTNPQTIDLFLAENRGNNLKFPPLRVFVGNLSVAEEIPMCDLLFKKVDINIFDLSGNAIEEIPTESCIIGQVKILRLNNNMIRTVGRLRLTNQSAEYNRITDIELRSNIIESISINAFEGLNKLQKIDLRHNNLVSLPDLSYIATAEFKSLQLDDNRLKCDCNLVWLQQNSKFTEAGKITGRCAYPSSQEGCLFSCFTYESVSCGDLVKPLTDAEEKKRQEVCQLDNYADVRDFTAEAEQATRIHLRWRKIGPGRLYGYNIVYTSRNLPGKSFIVHPIYANLTLSELKPGTRYEICLTVMLFHLVFPFDSGPSYCVGADTYALVRQDTVSPVTIGLSISLAIVLLILVLVFIGIAVHFRRQRNVTSSSFSKTDEGQSENESPEIMDPNYLTPQFNPDDDIGMYEMPTH